MELKVSALHKTWLLDLDGTLVVHNGYKMYGHDIWLDGAREFLTAIPEEDMMIFLTSRTKEYEEITIKFLRENEIRYDHIIFAVPYGERIVINDKKPSNLKTAIAVNRQRNMPWDMEIVIDSEL